MNNIPKRKPIRIENYDYSAPGAYFITVCINNRKPILWNVGAATCRPFSLSVFPGGTYAITRPYYLKDLL